MTDGQLRFALTDLSSVSSGDRPRLVAKIVAALGERGGHFDCNDFRHSVEKDGGIKQSLAWNDPGRPSGKT